MTTLQDLKTEYQTKLDTQATEQAQQDQARDALRQLELDSLKPRIITWIANREGVDEAELSQYGEVTGDWDDWNEKFRYAIFTLVIPEHQPITFTFYKDDEGKVVKPNNKWWTVAQSGRSPETLGEALTLAYQIYWNNQAYIARETVESQEYEASKVAKQEQNSQEQTQREDILVELAKDPIAFLLLKTFAEIQQERAGFAEQVTNLEEAMGNAEYHYDAALSATRRRIEQERQEVERVKDEARSLQYRVDDLDSELQKTKRQQKGW